VTSAPGADPIIRTSLSVSDGTDVVATFECESAAGEWSASGDVSRREQGLVISRLEVSPGPNGVGGVTGGMLQKVPVGHILRHVRAELGPDSVPPTTFEETPLVRRIREGGRVTLDDELLREVAHRYWVYTGPGQPSGAIKRLAADFQRPEETIRTWVARARREEWLGPSVKGRAGAEAGPKLRYEFELGFR
jgi:hypothetical protein